MFILRMLKKGRSGRGRSLIQLALCVLLVSLSIYTWVLSGCPGFQDCYLCETLSPDFFLNPAINSSVDDFTRLVDLRDFTFLKNNLVCNDSDVILLVLVHSDPYNFDNRVTIRNTWGRIIGDKFKLLFLMGIPNSTHIQRRLDEENEANKDLVQGNFMDHYRNLTYKHVMALKWTKYFCRNIRYLLKTDDDIFVNFPSFLNYLDLRLPETGLMRCLPIYQGRVKRSSRSKWRVSWSEYKFRMYPPFCQGFAILYSPDVALTLYSKAQTSNYFWIDDVFITGILALSTNFTPSTFGKFMLEPDEYQSLMRRDSNHFSYLLGPWNLATDDIQKLWDRASKSAPIRFVGATES